MCLRRPSVVFSLRGALRPRVLGGQCACELKLPVDDAEPVRLEQARIGRVELHPLPLPDQVVEDRANLLGRDHSSVSHGRVLQRRAADAPAYARSERPAASPTAFQLCIAPLLVRNALSTECGSTRRDAYSPEGENVPPREQGHRGPEKKADRFHECRSGPEGPIVRGRRPREAILNRCGDFHKGSPEMSTGCRGRPRSRRGVRTAARRAATPAPASRRRGKARCGPRGRSYGERAANTTGREAIQAENPP